MRGFRIGGVVAMCRRLELLAATSTLSPERSEQVRRRAAEVVLQVEALCSRHAHPTHLLPRPTLLALRRLRVLAALGLPSTSTEPPPAAKPEPPPAPRSAPPMRSIAPLESTLRLRGTLAVLKGLFERLSRPEELDAISQAAGVEARRLDALSRRCGGLHRIEGRPGVAARQIVWLSQEGVVRDVALGLTQLRRDLWPEARFAPHVGLGLWSVRRPVVKLQPILATAGADLLSRIARAMKGAEDLDLARDLDFFVSGRLDAGLSRTRGRVFDLEAMFEEVNGRYFKGAIARPTLSWAPVVSTRVMGRYFPHQDRVELSPLLDDERLEADTVAFVLYHELLHKHHGAEHRKGRRHVHTRAFRRDEAAYAEAPLHDARLNEFFAAVSAARLLS